MRFAWQHQQDPAPRYDRKIDDEDDWAQGARMRIAGRGYKAGRFTYVGLPPPPDSAPGPRSLVPSFILRLPPSGGSPFRPLVPGQSLFNLGQSFIHFRPPHHHVPEASNGA